MQFSHLHVHTQFSLLDGAASIKNLYKKAIKNNMPALAISDHGNMFGVFEFVKEAYNHKNDDGSLKVKPIVGCEFYITKDRQKKTFTKDDKDPRNHQILLAKNEEGYKNLVKLTSLGYIEGMYSKYPRIDKELIHKYHKGLIATTCCLGALVPQTILKKGEAEAENEFKWWLNIFQDDYYVELQRHGIPDQDKVNEILLKFAKKYNVKVIASNDTHYVDQEDFNAHDILLCINTSQKQSTPALREFSDDDVNVKNKRFAFANDQFFLKSGEQMLEAFKDIPEALDNTNEIVDKVDLLNLNKDIMLPFFEVPPTYKSQDEYLAHLTWSGAKERYKILTPEHEERLSFELGVIKEMGFAGYFLIVSDFIRHGRDIGVFIGPGRGSAAGSAVAYCIGITNIDPVKYNLLFERFLNPERKSMPDIDTDFDDDGRQKVIDYVVDKYGKNQVAQIITYTTMAAKSSIADVARVMDLSLEDSRSLTKLVPEKPGVKLKRVLHAPIYKKEDKDDEPSLETKEEFKQEDLTKVINLREIYNSDDLRSKVLKEAEKLEGSVRNTGIHASAIIIAPMDLLELMPVATSKESNLLMTQIEGNSIESAGVIKMDFLGLRTLSILKTALHLIKVNHDVTIDIDNLPLDDDKTFELFQRGETNGIFQFESAGMQKALKELKPDKFEHLIATNALYRPGPMDYIPSFIARRHGKEKVEYDLDDMQEHLEDTYGITVYQEQVMMVSQKIAGFTKGEADVLRKAMGKKNIKELNKMEPLFLEGAKAKGHKEEKLKKIWNDWKAFAQYAFNKSHATCYAYVAYQTAFLKAHYPSEFMAANLNHAGTIERTTFLIHECKSMGLSVLGLDINESENGFMVNKNGEIRFGFKGVKGLGDAAIELLIAERKKNGFYKDIFDLVKRVNLRAVSKKFIEGLVYSGAFDNFKEYHRAQYLYQPPADVNGIEKIVKFGSQFQAQEAQTANTLFGDLQMPEATTPKLPNCPEWSLTEKLKHEKEATGIFMTGHPLDNFMFEMRHYQFDNLIDFNTAKNELEQGNITQKNFRVAGLITSAQKRQTKTGKDYAVITLEDYTGSTEFFLWREDYQKYLAYIQEGTIVMMELHLKQKYKQDVFEFSLSKMQLLESVKLSLSKEMRLTVHPQNVTQEMIDFLHRNCKEYPGNTKLQFNISDFKNSLAIKLFSHGNGITVNDEIAHYINTHPQLEVNMVTN